MTRPRLYVVHCVDAEGPLFESTEATFERLKEIYGLDVEPSHDLLTRLQQGSMRLGSPELERAVAETVAPRLLESYGTWETIDAMLDRLDRPALRMALPDVTGKGWIVNWHCLAHVGFDPGKNPRRRVLGVHAVFDHYLQRYGASPADRIHWHFHPVPRTREAHASATTYFNGPELFEVISRRVLERRWFPCVNRPGFHAERPDSHWFLEQWIPFDIANNNAGRHVDQPDAAGGRFGDWRRAPAEWVVYHPDHDDYQVPGRCRRAIARCLNLGGRFNRITQSDVDDAFTRARSESVVMAFSDHDFRDVESDVREMLDMLGDAAGRFGDVPWVYADAADAMREALGLNGGTHARFQVELTNKGTNTHRLDIRLDGPPFGPQPWLCYALRDGPVWYDNLDFGLDPWHWHYTFDRQTVPLGDVIRIGLATNTPAGRTTVTLIDPETGRQESAFLN
ncbi:MAG: hypothetical protein AB1806_18515 [Acidobacteriota bacterium]